MKRKGNGKFEWQKQLNTVFTVSSVEGKVFHSHERKDTNIRVFTERNYIVCSAKKK